MDEININFQTKFSPFKTKRFSSRAEKICGKQGSCWDWCIEFEPVINIRGGTFSSSAKNQKTFTLGSPPQVAEHSLESQKHTNQS